MQIDKQEEKQNAPSSSSSPSHEFSFTISLQPSSAAKIPDKSKSLSSTTPPPPFDLSPADEIFFHGHLLPLHLLAHLPVSPRSSTNSLDSFTLPIKELSENNNNNNKTFTTTDDDQYINIDQSISQESTLLERKVPRKSKSFFLFGLPRWRKTRENDEEYQEYQGQRRNKSKFDVSRVLKRYMRLIKPFISLRNYKRGNNNNNNSDPQRQPHSFSGNLRVRSNSKKGFMRGRRGELFSAPASMSTSPTNSGLLVASGACTPTTKSDSTMEELQAAIQAAIAHCKKSIATEDINQSAVITT